MIFSVFLNSDFPAENSVFLVRILDVFRIRWLVGAFFPRCCHRSGLSECVLVDIAPVSAEPVQKPRASQRWQSAVAFLIPQLLGAREKRQTLFRPSLKVLRIQ